MPFSFVRRARDLGHSMAASFRLAPDEKIFGCGESFTRLDKRGQKIILYVRDAMGAQSQRMYKPIPFFLSSRGYGMFVHTSAPTTFDFGQDFDQSNVIYTGDDELDLFVFLGTPKEVLEEYTSVTGRSPVPPLWSFGLWMSRITYNSEEQVRDVAKKLREHKIPADVIHLDTGWFETDWQCDYKFAKSRFDDPAKMMSDLKKDGFRISLWQLPYFTSKNALFPEAAEKGYFVKNVGGQLPAEDGIVDFSNPQAQAWYEGLLTGLLKLSVGAIKVDFGEDAPLDGVYASGRTGWYEHNLYPLRYNKIVADLTEKITGDHIIWARSAWAGSQRYPLHWGGDAENTDSAMAATLRAGLSLGLSGFTYWSHDVGGFVGGRRAICIAVVAVRRAHLAHPRHGAPPREPWEYDEAFTDDFRRAMELRYALMPYIYAQAKDAPSTATRWCARCSSSFPTTRRPGSSKTSTCSARTCSSRRSSKRDAAERLPAARPVDRLPNRHIVRRRPVAHDRGRGDSDRAGARPPPPPPRARPRAGAAFPPPPPAPPPAPSLRRGGAGEIRWNVASALLAGTALLGGALLVASQAPAAPAAAIRFVGEAPPPASTLTLWYREPAADRPATAPRPAAAVTSAEWVRALPVGNGRLGAMVFGGVVNERLQLNEDTLWAGGPYNPVNPDAKDALPEVRRLIAAGEYAAAAKLASEKVMAKPLAQMPYQTVGDLRLTFPAATVVENYRRDLDLATATARVSYTADGITFTREVFASAPDQVIVVRLTASRPGRISFEARMQTPQRATVEATADGDLVMRGTNGEGMGTTADGRPISGALRFEARVRLITTGGSRIASDEAIVVRDADAVTLLIAAATSYRSYDNVSGDPAANVVTSLGRASGTAIENLRARHLRDYRQLFDRVTLDLGRSAAASTPTEERVRNYVKGGDEALAALYFQYARYLLIASSRPGSQPANLQGIWNESMHHRGAASTPSTSTPR